MLYEMMFVCIMVKFSLVIYHDFKTYPKEKKKETKRTEPITKKRKQKIKEKAPRKTILMLPSS